MARATKERRSFLGWWQYLIGSDPLLKSKENDAAKTWFLVITGAQLIIVFLAVLATFHASELHTWYMFVAALAFGIGDTYYGIYVYQYQSGGFKMLSRQGEVVGVAFVLLLASAIPLAADVGTFLGLGSFHANEWGLQIAAIAAAVLVETGVRKMKRLIRELGDIGSEGDTLEERDAELAARLVKTQLTHNSGSRHRTNKMFYWSTAALQITIGAHILLRAFAPADILIETPWAIYEVFTVVLAGYVRHNLHVQKIHVPQRRKGHLYALAVMLGSFVLLAMGALGFFRHPVPLEILTLFVITATAFWWGSLERRKDRTDP